MKEKLLSLLTAAALLALGLAFNSCALSRRNTVSADGTMSGRLSLSGAFALYPLAVKWAEEFQRLHPDVKIEIDGGGAGKGITDALANQVDFGMVSREISDAETQLGALGFPVAVDAVVPTINEHNPYYAQLVKRGITRQQAANIWLNGIITSWGQLLGNGDATRLTLFSRSDACGAAEIWAAWLGVHQEDLRGEGVNGDPSMANVVSKNPLAIGYNNVGYAYDNVTGKPMPGIRVLPVDVNGNGKIDPEEDFYADKQQFMQALSEGRYPAPPMRSLYLVTKGVPSDPVAVAFLKFVLTEGQKYNLSAGYVSAPRELRDGALKKLVGKSVK